MIVSGEEWQIEKRRDALVGYLKTLSSEQKQQLATALEQKREAGEASLPHLEILAVLRPWLVELQAKRFPTVQRMTCQPLEDFLSASDPRLKFPSQIARSTIRVMWHFLTEDLADQNFLMACEDFQAAADSGDPRRVRIAARGLWRAGADALAPVMEEAAADEAAAKKLRQRLGGTRPFEDMREIAAIFDVGDALEVLKGDLPPKPIMGLSDPHVSRIKRCFEEIQTASPGRETYIVLGIVARLRQSHEILKVLEALKGKLSQSRLASSGLDVVADTVIRNLEQRGEEILHLARDTARDTDLARLINDFAESYSGTNDRMAVNQKNEWGRRMLKSREEVGKTVSARLLRTAPQTVLQGLEKSISDDDAASARIEGPRIEGLDGLPRIPVTTLFRQFPDEDSVAEAEDRAAAVSGLRRKADILGVGNQMRKSIETLREGLNGHGEKVIDLLPAMKDSEMDHAEAHLMSTVRLLEIVAGPDEADTMRKRGERQFREVTERRRMDAESAAL